MTKVSVELKDDKFYYEYEVGTTSGHGNHPLCVDSFTAFVNIMSLCSKLFTYTDRADIKEIECFAYLERHPEIISKYLGTLKKGGKNDK